MRWSERQRAMLREMGVRIWFHEAAASDAPPESNGAPTAAPIERAQPTAATPSFSSRAAVAVSCDVDARPADWLIVGEPLDAAPMAPAALVGEQQRLLAHMLFAVRVSHDAPSRRGRACHVVLAAGGAARIGAALERVSPRVALALGRAAAEALLDINEPLGRLRGVVHERAGVKVVVTFPLAYLLRHPNEKAKAWADLCLAVRALEADAA
jgi:DNA polymerase